MSHEAPPIELQYYPDHRRAAWAIDRDYVYHEVDADGRVKDAKTSKAPKKYTYWEAQDYFNSQASTTYETGPADLSCECCKGRDKLPPPLISENPANFCTTCGLDFSTPAAFDEHLIGEYEPYDRRCLTVPELEGEGFTRDRHDRWRLPSDRRPRLRVEL